MNPAELEFLAEDELVQIIPKFKMDAVQMISYTVSYPIALPMITQKVIILVTKLIF